MDPVVLGSSAACENCQKRWKREFPAYPPGCFNAGNKPGKERGQFFDLETGWPKACEMPAPDVANPVVEQVFKVLVLCQAEVTGDGLAGISIARGALVAERLGFRVDEFWLELFAAAAGELTAMRQEDYRESIDKDRRGAAPSGS